MMKNKKILLFLIVLSGCTIENFVDFVDLKKPIVHIDTSDAASIYYAETYKYFRNLEFSHSASKLMAIRYYSLFLKGNYINGKNNGLLPEKVSATFPEAKNTFICTILDGRTQKIVDKKQEIEISVKLYIEIVEFEKLVTENIKNSYIENKQEPRTVDEKNKYIENAIKKNIADKYGLNTEERLENKLSDLVDYQGVYEKCGLYSSPTNYLDRPEAKYID